MKELLTATRMATLLGCPRRHFWRYEIGLRRTVDADALRFGTAWHTAMEARWTGADVEAAFAAALAGKTELGEVQLATLSGMLAGYYTCYAADPIKSVHPEVEFRHPLAGSRTFESAGKIDGLAGMHDGRLGLVEHKTAGCDIAPDSDYWLRLRGNAQVMQYVLAARALGWDVALVIYDVARKPAIRQKQGETAEQFGDRLFGWTDWDWAKWSQEPEAFAGAAVQAVVETIQGERGAFSSIKYINPPGGGQRLEKADAKGLAAKYGAKTRALFGGSTQFTTGGSSQKTDDSRQRTVGGKTPSPRPIDNAGSTPLTTGQGRPSPLSATGGSACGGKGVGDGRTPPPPRQQAEFTVPPLDIPPSSMEVCWDAFCRENPDQSERDLYKLWAEYVKSVAGKLQNDCTPADWGLVLYRLNAGQLPF